MRHADGTPILIEGQPVEFQPAFQLGLLQGHVRYALETCPTTAGAPLTDQAARDLAQLATSYAAVRWYQRAAGVARAIRRAAEAEQARGAAA